LRKQNTVSASAASSAATMDSQIPSKPKTIGKSNTAAIWQIRVHIKEITAEISPILSDVNKELPKILKPQSRNEME